MPAFNESRCIARAIRTLQPSSIIGEIIVVDDGSTDRTTDIARERGARVITLPKNMGKGHAMDIGVAHAKHEIILFCDADMCGFSPERLSEFILPVHSGTIDMVIGMRPIASYLRHIFPFITQLSGFRAMQKKRWSEIPNQFTAGYQIELAMNFVARRNVWHIQYTDVLGLTHSVKESKFGLLNGLIARARMIGDIFLFFLGLYILKRREANAALKMAIRGNKISN